MVHPELHEDNDGYVSNKLIDVDVLQNDKIESEKVNIINPVFGGL
jgi:hypothetical protein